MFQNTPWKRHTSQLRGKETHRSKQVLWIYKEDLINNDANMAKLLTILKYTMRKNREKEYWQVGDNEDHVDV